MKHTPFVTLLLAIVFVLSQVVGVFVVSAYVDVEQSTVDGEVVWEELPAVAGVQLERPEVSENFSFAYVLIALLIGTALLLGIIRFGARRLWKAWFFLAILVSLFIAFGAFTSALIAALLALAFAIMKLFPQTSWPLVLGHNIVEIFMYGGIAALLVPIFNMWAIVALLLLISLYDAYAVWKSKHMIKLATFQMDSGVFAGAMIPYAKPAKAKRARSTNKSAKRKSSKKVRLAILGGGDLAIPLLFTGTVFKFMGLGPALWIIPFSTASLILLFVLAKKDAFYPAMPFLSAGCLLGYAVVFLAGLL